MLDYTLYCSGKITYNKLNKLLSSVKSTPIPLLSQVRNVISRVKCVTVLNYNSTCRHVPLDW